MRYRGCELFEDNDGREFWWDRCFVEVCPNFVCEPLSTVFCWPHAMSGGSNLLKNRKEPLTKKHKSTKVALLDRMTRTEN